MTLRRSMSAALPIAVVMLGLVACGPAGSLAPTVEPTSTSAAPAPTTTPIGEPTPTPDPTPASTPTPTPTPAATAAAPAAARTPPAVPLLPELSLPGTEVPALGPEPVYGSRYDYVITCDPRVPMWLDDGDGLLSWQATDRPIQCEEGQLAMIVVSVRFEEARLLTLYEDDIGVPIAYRTLTGTPFAPEAVEAVAAATGAELVDVEVPCYDTWVGNLTVGEHRAECVFMHTPARAVDVPLRDLLTAARLSPNFEREVAIHAS